MQGKSVIFISSVPFGRACGLPKAVYRIIRAVVKLWVIAARSIGRSASSGKLGSW